MENNKLTYRQAYDKIIEAYFRDEIKPFDCSFCFCGTLSPNDNWMNAPQGCATRLPEQEYPYSVAEYGKMEKALFKPFPKLQQLKPGFLAYPGTVPEYIKYTLGDKYEEILFEGMCHAIESLKKIHKKRGEDVDNLPSLTKRQLQKV